MKEELCLAGASVKACRRPIKHAVLIIRCSIRANGGALSQRPLDRLASSELRLDVSQFSWTVTVQVGLNQTPAAYSLRLSCQFLSGIY